jgi:hypothetical protein
MHIQLGVAAAPSFGLLCPRPDVVGSRETNVTSADQMAHPSERWVGFDFV